MAKKSRTHTNKKALFLPKNKGGINIKEPEVHNLAMRIKHLLNLKYKKDQLPWSYLATYWLAKDIYKFGKEYNYLKNNNRAKTTNQNTPFYYYNLIYYIKTQNPNLPKIKANTKLLYTNILQEGSKQLKIAGEIQWQKYFPSIDFQKIWKNTYQSYAQPYLNDLYYRLLHYSTKTNDYMHKCSNNINPNYDHCGRTEDNIRLLTKCPRIKKLWTHYEPILTKLTEETNTPQEHLLMFNVKNSPKHTTKLTLTIIEVILYEIWESRNNNNYDKKLLP